MQLCVAVGIDEVGQLLLCQPGMQRGSAPLRIAIGGIEEFVDRRAPRFNSTFIAARGNSNISLGAIGWPLFMAMIRLSLSAGMALPVAGSITPFSAPGPR